MAVEEGQGSPPWINLDSNQWMILAFQEVFWIGWHVQLSSKASGTPTVVFFVLDRVSFLPQKVKPRVRFGADSTEMDGKRENRKARVSQHVVLLEVLET